MARKLKVFRTHIGFDDLIVASPSRKAALDAWGASAHLFTQGFAAETDEPALVKAALARPGMVLRRQFGSRGEFKAGPPALRLVESPVKHKPVARAPAPKKPATGDRSERQKPAHHNQAATGRAERREHAEREHTERRAAETEARAEARQEKQREKEQKQAAAEHRRDLQAQLQSIQGERKQQLGDIDRREQELARERREIEQSFETQIVALRRQLRKT